jgi:hypothetical protein
MDVHALPASHRNAEQAGAMRRWIATVLQLGIFAGTTAMLLLQRWVAEIDDEEAKAK